MTATWGVTARDAGLGLAASLPMDCEHDPVPVEAAVTGEVVAMLCAGCLRELPISWGCPACEWVEAPRLLCEQVSSLVLATPCPRHGSS